MATFVTGRRGQVGAAWCPKARAVPLRWLSTGRVAALMGSLWTPDGERPVSRPSPTSTPADAPRSAPQPFGADPDDPDDLEPTDEEFAAMTAELLSTPATAIIANHCVGFFQLAALHLSQERPNLTEASLAIDALGAVVDQVGARLGEDGATLAEALAQIRLAYVQVKAGL